MAWRIHEHILRGEIDNRIRGRVTGRVWLAGVEAPLTLNLTGDCHPDLAGCLLTFENPSPVPMTTEPPAFRQNGTAGDITAARKVRVFDVPIEEALDMCKRGEKPPEHMANCLYLEWFSELGGRVVIESVDYKLAISEPAWRFTRQEIDEKKRRAEEQGGAFITAVDADGNAEEWDEFRCEQMLRESDALTEKYGRLLEKYADHPDSERIIAHEMGWTWLEEALDAQEAAQAEGETEEQDESADDDEAAAGDFEDHGEEPPDPAREGIDWVRDGDGRIVHPLGKRANDAMHAMLDELKAAGHFPDCKDETLADFVGHFMNLSVKLRAHLQGLACGDRWVEPGMIVAKLKRSLEILNQTLTAADALAGTTFLPPESLVRHRAALFTLREEMLTLIKRLRG